MKHLILAGALLPLVALAAPMKPDVKILQLQVVLSKLGFSPGVLDGRPGESLNDALRGFQESRGLAKSGKLDVATQKALAPYAIIEPTKKLAMTEASLRGPFTSPFPKEEADKAKLPSLDYRNALEALAERFHTTNAMLIALNGGDTRLAPGVEVAFSQCAAVVARLQSGGRCLEGPPQRAERGREPARSGEGGRRQI
jgi:peptidoglycan hydrolase-like protein with peptidoglycan-binding domain